MAASNEQPPLLCDLRHVQFCREKSVLETSSRSEDEKVKIKKLRRDRAEASTERIPGKVSSGDLLEKYIETRDEPSAV